MRYIRFDELRSKDNRPMIIVLFFSYKNISSIAYKLIYSSNGRRLSLLQSIRLLKIVHSDTVGYNYLVCYEK